MAPTRILDTRDGTGRSATDPPGPRGPAATTTVAVTDTARTTTGQPPTGIPDTATAVAVNLTAVDATTATFLTAWAGGPRPPTSNLNPAPGRVTANTTVVPLAPDGTLTLYNNTGTLHVIADLHGWYDTGGTTAGAGYTPVTAARILDTRDGTGRSATDPPGPSAPPPPPPSPSPTPPAPPPANPHRHPRHRHRRRRQPHRRRRHHRHLPHRLGRRPRPPPPTSTPPPAASPPTPPSSPSPPTARSPSTTTPAPSTSSPTCTAGTTPAAPPPAPATPRHRRPDPRHPRRHRPLRHRSPGPLGPAATTTVAVTDTARTTTGQPPPASPTPPPPSPSTSPPSTPPPPPSSPPGPAAPTPTSNLNPAPGRVTANTTVVPLAPDGTLTLYNNTGTLHVIADLHGWYEPAPIGALVGRTGALRTPGTLPPDVQPSATGDPVRFVPLDTWRWPAGTSAFFPALADDGRVLMGTMSQVANQVVPTQDTMSVAAYDPVVAGFSTVAIPTRTTGRDPGGVLGPRAIELGAQHVGGGDVSDVCAVPGTGRALAVTAMPYKRWQRAQQADEHQLLQLRADPAVDAGGTFRLGVGGSWTPPLPFGTPAATVAAALAAVPTVGGPANIDVQGRLAPPGTARYVVVFRGAFHGQDVAPVQLDAGSLTGSAAGGFVDDRAYGSYPALTVLDTSGPAVAEAGTATALASLTPDDLHAAAAGGDAVNADVAFPAWYDAFLDQPTNAFGESGFRDSRGMVECDVLPASKHVVVAQYFNSAAAPNGSLLVLAGDGTLRAFCGAGQRHRPTPGAVPVAQCTLQAATPVTLPQPIHQKVGGACVTTSTIDVPLLPRDVRASPKAVGDAEHLTVIYDAPYLEWDDTCTTSVVRGYPAPIQELRYDAAVGTLTPVSPVLTAPALEAGTLPAFMTAAYADDGTLFVGVANHGGSLATTWPLYVAAFAEAGDGSHLTPPGWTYDPLAPTMPVAVAQPTTTADLTLRDTAGNRTGGFLAALEYSPRHHALLYAYQYGRVRPFHWDGASLTAGRDVELHGERQHTVAPGDPPLGVAKGVVDDRVGALYVVLAGYAPTTARGYDTPPAVIDQQYLVAVDLARALSATGAAPPSPPPGVADASSWRLPSGTDAVTGGQPPPVRLGTARAGTGAGTTRPSVIVDDTEAALVAVPG
ncbi:MAG: hypothetical protein R2726_20080 [Acidimicrobiales bacterium]